MAQNVAEHVDARFYEQGFRDRGRTRLTGIVSAVLADPPGCLPSWGEREWRAALRYRDTGPRPSKATLARAEIRDRALSDPRVAEVVAWAAKRRPLSYQLGAIAAALAALGAGLAADGTDPEAFAARLIGAVDHAAVLAYRPVPDRAMLTDCSEIADPRVSSGERLSAISAVVGYLLGCAGVDVALRPLLARRVEVAVDVCLGVWLRDAPAGGGLPQFRPAEARNHRHRVAFLLGADRDLQRLVEGPPPGRGRPLQTARHRGLAYWVAVTVVAGADAEPAPIPPPEVTAHWRSELSRLTHPTSDAIEPVEVALRLG